MIRVNHLHKSVDGNKKKVLRDITVQFEGGEMIGVVGPSGSGKAFCCAAWRCGSVGTAGIIRGTATR
ncbi:hypothetical protein HMSSN036_16030 [Paenibacillus macerans]|nr:hypothetical protein HMSSN036_16030 [Paenibacillus macerans]